MDKLYNNTDYESQQSPKSSFYSSSYLDQSQINQSLLDEHKKLFNSTESAKNSIFDEYNIYSNSEKYSFINQIVNYNVQNRQTLSTQSTQNKYIIEFSYSITDMISLNNNLFLVATKNILGLYQFEFKEIVKVGSFSFKNCLNYILQKQITDDSLENYHYITCLIQVSNEIIFCGDNFGIISIIKQTAPKNQQTYQLQLETSFNSHQREAIIKIKKHNSRNNIVLTASKFKVILWLYKPQNQLECQLDLNLELISDCNFCQDTFIIITENCDLQVWSLIDLTQLQSIKLSQKMLSIYILQNNSVLLKGENNSYKVYQYCQQTPSGTNQEIVEVNSVNLQQFDYISLNGRSQFLTADINGKVIVYDIQTYKIIFKDQLQNNISQVYNLRKNVFGFVTKNNQSLNIAQLNASKFNYGNIKQQYHPFLQISKQIYKYFRRQQTTPEEEKWSYQFITDIAINGYSELDKMYYAHIYIKQRVQLVFLLLQRILEKRNISIVFYQPQKYHQSNHLNNLLLFNSGILFGKVFQLQLMETPQETLNKLLELNYEKQQFKKDFCKLVSKYLILNTEFNTIDANGVCILEIKQPNITVVFQVACIEAFKLQNFEFLTGLEDFLKANYEHRFIELIQNNLVEKIKIPIDLFDEKFYKRYSTKHKYQNSTLGGLPYIKPIGWEKFGLKILNVYDDENDNWISDKNQFKQWGNIYHTFRLVPSLFEGQMYNQWQETHKEQDITKEDFGIHVVCDTKIIEHMYCELVPVTIKGKKKQFIIVIQSRVRPGSIQNSLLFSKEFLLKDPTNLRPCSLLIKEVKDSDPCMIF